MNTASNYCNDLLFLLPSAQLGDSSAVACVKSGLLPKELHNSTAQKLISAFGPIEQVRFSSIDLTLLGQSDSLMALTQNVVMMELGDGQFEVIPGTLVSNRQSISQCRISVKVLFQIQTISELPSFSDGCESLQHDTQLDWTMLLTAAANRRLLSSQLTIPVVTETPVGYVDCFLSVEESRQTESEGMLYASTENHLVAATGDVFQRSATSGQLVRIASFRRN